MENNKHRPSLSFNPESLPRELKRHYISASDTEISEMLASLGMKNLGDLYNHISSDNLFTLPPDLPEELSYEDLQEHLWKISCKNKTGMSFIGDGLPDFKVPENTIEFVSNLRGLTTAYTPYQPERSQGTLIGHWIYQNAMAQLTGFEAINVSLYDRAMATYEAIVAAVRIGKRKGFKVLISRGLFPGDREVLDTLISDTQLQFLDIPLDPETGLSSITATESSIAAEASEIVAIVFPQVNNLGLIEDVDALTNLANNAGIPPIAVIDPILLAPGGLKTPAEFGEEGVTIIAGEAQHLAIPPTFGGPGLGVFGVRHNEKNSQHIRTTPGRFIGKAQDRSGRDCRVSVLSTREQHIRKDKATSNVCSNQAFLATLAGASLLVRGDDGLAAQIKKAREEALLAARQLTSIKGIDLAFPQTPFFNEILLRCQKGVLNKIFKECQEEAILAGLDVTDRSPSKESGDLWKISFSDKTDASVLINKVLQIAIKLGLGEEDDDTLPAQIESTALRALPAAIPCYTESEVHDYYQKLAELNLSPDNAIYPLGSCTMKYNPYINDWAAGLPGFTQLHPQAPESWSQGSLEVLYETEEWFKKITGLAGVTTQPVAGAQGELVGVKLIQAYHRDRGDSHRDVIFIPESAHGTNFATAAMAGLVSGRNENGELKGIVLLKSNSKGEMDFADFSQKLEQYGDRLSAIMVTNPNTCGIFESRFKEIADAVHNAGGLVYMDGANMNAIAGWVDLGAIGVDAVHNNLHKTWTIPHGGGGPGDAFVAVSERLVDFLPGVSVIKTQEGQFKTVRAPKSIGSFHRHYGNFGHKIRCYSYLCRLGREGVRRMAAIAVLSSRYLLNQLRETAPTLPALESASPRLHEFILTLSPEDFSHCESAGVPKATVIPSMGKLFLDFGYHAPTVAWPETFGLMFEPTESFTKAELDRFIEAVKAIFGLVRENPGILQTAPHFTPVDRVDEVGANRNLVVFSGVKELPPIHPNREDPLELLKTPVEKIKSRLLEQQLTTS